jgi:hypothetical protein
MPLLIPALYFAGAAALSLFAVGCATTGPKTPPQAPPKPPTPPPSPPPPSAPQEKYPPSALDFVESFPECQPNGYFQVLADLKMDLTRYRGKSVLVPDFLNTLSSDFCMTGLMGEPKQAKIVQNLVQDMARSDGRPNNLSLFDGLFAAYQLYEKLWKQSWEGDFLGANPAGRIRIIGNALQDPAIRPAVSQGSRDLLTSLSAYLQADSLHPARSAKPLLEYFLNQKEPGGFANFLRGTFADFLQATDEEKARRFRAAIQARFPDEKTVQDLSPLLIPEEIAAFTRECFKNNLLASLSLFENLFRQNIKLGLRATGKKSGEVEFFPNLPQSTPFPQRQKAIDEFLGTPVLVVKKKPAAAGQAGRTTIKKYLWAGDTEVFSIDSGKPGPTTLVFSPHLHEDNTRRQFHWIKDIPLQTGRLILIPEANRALGLVGGNTVPMNQIFNEALSDERIDYLIVRRTEYLMGLVDGMVGLHEWKGRAPFFISDIIMNVEKQDDPRLHPVASPWVPAQVKKIEGTGREIIPEGSGDVSAEEAKNFGLGSPPQVQWKIAEFAAQKLEKLTGSLFPFQISPLVGESSRRSDNATGYMNLFLKKPAMTFEAAGLPEHGQLLAMATYALLLGFGHKIHPSFEEKLKNPLPETEPELYVGLPVELAPSAKAEPPPHSSDE